MKKRILVVSHNPFSSTANNGKTLEAILGGYDAKELSQLFFSEMMPDLEFCQCYFRLTDRDVIRNTFLPWRNSFSMDFSAGIEKEKPQKIRLQRVKRFVQNVPFVRDFLWFMGRWKISPLFDWVEHNKPEVIFYVGGNCGFSHIVARKLAKKYNVPLVVYFTDDYLIYPICRNWFDVVQRVRMKRFYQKTVRYACMCFAIGEKMAETYAEYFKKPFYSIMNMAPINEMPLIRHEGIVIAYFGGLHLGRWKAILKLGEILQHLQKRIKCEIVFNVYAKECPENIVSLFEKQHIVYKGFVGSGQLQGEFAKSDILLHVESSDEYYRSLTRLSVSTKIPEYLSTGRCVLGFGPKEVASMQLLSENGIGFVLSDELPNGEIEQALFQLLTSKELRENLSQRALDYAKAKFNPEMVRADFMEKINEIVNV